jgi:hypothetical protein
VQAASGLTRLLARVGLGISLPGGADNEGVALAAAAAERGGAGSAAAAAQFQREGQDEPGATHADRIAQGDGAAVDVDPSGGDAEIAHRRQSYPREGLVDLDQVQVADVQPAVSPQGGTDRLGRLVQQGRIRPGDGAVAAELGEPGQSQLPARSLLICTTAHAPSDNCDADPAVIVPSSLNAGGSAASRRGVVPGRTPPSSSTVTSPLRPAR